MNFILPMGDFLRKGGDVMLGDLVLEDSRLIIVRDEPFLSDPSIIIKAESIAGNFMSIEYQDKDSNFLGTMQGAISGHVFISPQSNKDVWIPNSTISSNCGLQHVLADYPARAEHWWITYNLMTG